MPKVDDAEYEQWVDDALEEVKKLLMERHREYGDDVIVTGGQEGLYYFSLAKLGRIKEAIDNKRAVKRDSWADLAGYATLALIWERWYE